MAAAAAAGETPAAAVKTVIFVRHGESEYNKAIRETGKDPLIRDAPLTEKGRSQAAAACEVLLAARKGVRAHGRSGAEARWLLLVSPLRRALDTAAGAWPEAFFHQAPDEARVEVWPDLRETITGCDDLGSSPAKLKEAYPHLAQQLVDLPPVWWSVPENLQELSPEGEAMREAYIQDPEAFEDADEAALDARLEALVRGLAMAPERLVVVVAHCELIGHLTRRLGLGKEEKGAPSGWWLRNCECRVAEHLQLRRKRKNSEDP